MKKLKKKIIERMTYEENKDLHVPMTRGEKLIVFIFILAAVGLVGMVVYDSFITVRGIH